MYMMRVHAVCHGVCQGVCVCVCVCVCVFIQIKSIVIHSFLYPFPPFSPNQGEGTPFTASRAEEIFRQFFGNMGDLGSMFDQDVTAGRQQVGCGLN